ncbi:MAG: hypothetical protein EON93_14250 [Burkholderiales bacterium]|nr:MAG: hypothetical protein EON93_14250 [Burkholderiales bacterium]
MPIPTGLYKLAFHSSYGDEYGVAVLTDDGRVRGGDSGMAYYGTFEQTGDALRMSVSVTQHRHVPGVVSVLGYNEMVVELEGLAADGSAELRGTSRQVPGVRFSARLSHLAD